MRLLFRVCATMALLSGLVVSAQDNGVIDAWVPKQRVGASTRASDRFAASFAMADDLLFVGAPKYNAFGAVFVYRETASDGWLEVTVLAQPDFAGGSFGTKVVTDGQLLLVGAANAVFVLQRVAPDRNNDAWQVLRILQAPGFGQVLALSQDYIAAGQPTFDGNRGQVLLYARANAVALPVALQPPNLQAGSYFGQALDFDFDTNALAVTRTNPTGAVYVYQHVPALVFPRLGMGTWRLDTPDLGVQPRGLSRTDFFGYTVQLWGDTLTASAFHHGTGGAAWVWQRDNDKEDESATWQEIQKLEPDNARPDQDFGTSLALSRSNDGVSTIVVGSPRAGVFDTGMVYTFVQIDSTGDSQEEAWTQQASLQHCGASRSDMLGSAVAMRGDDLIFAAAMKDDTTDGTGLVHVFEPGRLGVVRRLRCLLLADESTARRFWLGFW